MTPACDLSVRVVHEQVPMQPILDRLDSGPVAGSGWPTRSESGAIPAPPLEPSAPLEPRFISEQVRHQLQHDGKHSHRDQRSDEERALPQR